MGKVYYEIYDGRSSGIGNFICVTEDKEIADDICRNHPKYFKVMRIIPDKEEKPIAY